jgi:hypothetical protein
MGRVEFSARAMPNQPLQATAKNGPRLSGKAFGLTRMSWRGVIAGMIIWALGCTLHAWYYVASTLALPEIPDAYARSADFQLLMFALTRFPFWVAGLIMFFVYNRSATTRLAEQGHPRDAQGDARA